MKLVTADSSMIHAVGYDAEAQELEVIFTSGKIYRYTHVPKKVYQQLLASEAKGSYMRSSIIGLYPERKVSRRQ